MEFIPCATCANTWGDVEKIPVYCHNLVGNHTQFEMKFDFKSFFYTWKILPSYIQCEVTPELLKELKRYYCVIGKDTALRTGIVIDVSME